MDCRLNGLLQEFLGAASDIRVAVASGNLLAKVLGDHAKCTHLDPRQYKCDALHNPALPPFFGFGERAVRLSLPQASRVRLAAVVVGLRTEDTVQEPETVQRKARCCKRLSKW